jgi:hypothetical protein
MDNKVSSASSDKEPQEAHAKVNSPLTPAQCAFARLLGHFLAKRWHEEHNAQCTSPSARAADSCEEGAGGRSDV